jgi:CubicO group peptidase (beta-lactamase class C family)
VEDELAELVGTHKITGVAMAAFGPGRVYRSGAGHVGGPGTAVPTGDTIFQLGSITKTFTGLALAIRQCRGELSISDPAARHLPADLAPPVSTQHPITLAELVSHTSGMPWLPTGWDTDPRWNLVDLYAPFTIADLGCALRSTPPTVPGTYRYSNFAMGLLGQALGARDDAGYDRLIGSFTGRLGMADTRVRLSRAQLARKATGFAEGKPIPDMRLPTIAGAAALYSSADDLVRYVRAHLGEGPSSLRPAMELTRQPIAPAADTLSVGFAWHLLPLENNGHTMVWHNGATLGCSNFIGYVKESGVGVVVLSNSGSASEAVDIAGMSVLVEMDSGAA